MVLTADQPTSIKLEHQSDNMTFAQALRDKYIDQVEFDNHFVLPKDTIISTNITLVGFGKVTNAQRQLRNLISIDLSGMNITNLGEVEQLLIDLKRVRILNLANNFLLWEDVVTIASRLPNLKELILNSNPLYHEKPIDLLLLAPMKEIQSLSLGGINCSWTILVTTLARIWCKILQLDLWNNQLDGSKMIIEDEARLTSFTSSLRSLRLSCNNFVDISWLSKAGELSNLLELDLSRCKLTSIEINSNIAHQLEKLQLLNISYNELDSWKSIAQLYKLSALVHLICNENPLYISDKLARILTIGRLRQLKVLNREEISTNQRRDAEIVYLKKVFPEYQAFLEQSYEEFDLYHPSYKQLVQDYGIPEDLLKKPAVDDKVSLELRFGDRKEVRRVPRNLKVVNLKMLCKKQFNIRLSAVIKVTCFEKEPSESVINYELDKDGQTLHFYSVENNYIVVIEELGR